MPGIYFADERVGGCRHGAHAVLAGSGIVSRIAVIVLAAVALVPGLAAAERVHRYSIDVDADLAALRVDACFSGRAPAMLAVESQEATSAFVEGKTVTPQPRALAPNGMEMLLKGMPDDGCIAYSVSLAHARKTRDHSGNANRWTGRDLVTEVGLWFWRPPVLAADEDIEVSFRLPEGFGVSVPWRPVPDKAVPTYRVGRGAYNRTSDAAFGRFREIPIDVPGARLRLAVLNGKPAPDVEAMRRWIEDAARSVAAIYGRFPVPEPQVLVLPGAPAPEPTPWAYVLRGGQGSAHFSVNQRRPLREYVEDWTAPHELSHLLLPPTDPNDAWLSEGIASYYQNVTRARSGVLTPEEAWQNIHAGFRRGRKLDVKGLTLAQATQRMYRDNAYMRVYWQGAAIVLAGDVELRALTDGRQSLDTVLDAFGRCCLHPDREWTAREVFERFDAIAGMPVFVPILEAQIDTPGFPDLTTLYGRLGLDALGGKVALRSDAPLARARDAIMAPGPYRTPRALLGAGS